MSDEERRNTLLEETEDVPREKQIVSGGTGAQNSNIKYVNGEHREQVDNIQKYIYSKNYDEPGTDFVIFDNFAYVFDHPRDQRNVTDPDDYALEESYRRRANDDGFGLRKVIKVEDYEEAVNRLRNIVTAGEYAKDRDVERVVMRVNEEARKRGRNNDFSGVSNNGETEGRNGLLANGQQTSGAKLPKTLVQSGGDSGEFSERIESSDPFYSNAAKAVEGIKQEKAIRAT